MRAVGDEVVDLAADEPAIELQRYPEHESEDEGEPAEVAMEPARRRPWGMWLFQSLLAGIAAAWTAFFAWTYGSELQAAPSPERLIDLAGLWALPLVLVAALWLIVMRSSSREAARFGDAAALLSRESARLEDRLLVVNRELSLAREFLEAETRSLESLGRSAGQRLSEHADHIQALIHDNAAQIESIGEVSVAARDNMERLRNDLPVIANSARDVSNRIGQAGSNAGEQVRALEEQFAQLEAGSTRSGERVGELSTRVAEILAGFDSALEGSSTVVEERFAQLRDRAEHFHTELGTLEVQALAALTGRIEKLRAGADETSDAIREGESAAISAWEHQIVEMRKRLMTVLEEIERIDQRAIEASNEKLESLVAEAASADREIEQRNAHFAARLGERRDTIEADQVAALERLGERLDRFDEALQSRRDSHTAHITEVEYSAAALRDALARIGEDMDVIAERAGAAESSLTGTAETLGRTLEENAGLIDRSAGAISQLTDASVRLLELIQASAKHSRDDLPVAIAAFEQRLAEAESRTDTLRGLLSDMGDSGVRLDEAVERSEERSTAIVATLSGLIERLDSSSGEQDAAMDALREKLAALIEQSDVLSTGLHESSHETLDAFEKRAGNILSTVEENQAERIRTLAENIAAMSGDAIDEALKARAEQTIGDLDRASRRAAEVSREAAVQLRDQLAKVDELTRNLESRVAHARAQAEEKADNDFSRRVALITDSLNSNAIDIGKALTTEVTDTAWAAYLRGDRGIFTRRAVRLLDNTELREIAELYDADLDFREHVSRYIHDFEAMLRTLLSTREGNAIGVTILSSDMGKLYVTLAQAIERLRD